MLPHVEKAQLARPLVVVPSVVLPVAVVAEGSQALGVESAGSVKDTVLALGSRRAEARARSRAALLGHHSVAWSGRRRPSVFKPGLGIGESSPPISGGRLSFFVRSNEVLSLVHPPRASIGHSGRIPVVPSQRAAKDLAGPAPARTAHMANQDISLRKVTIHRCIVCGGTCMRDAETRQALKRSESGQCFCGDDNEALVCTTYAAVELSKLEEQPVEYRRTYLHHCPRHQKWYFTTTKQFNHSDTVRYNCCSGKKTLIASLFALGDKRDRRETIFAGVGDDYLVEKQRALFTWCESCGKHACQVGVDWTDAGHANQHPSCLIRRIASVTGYGLENIELDSQFDTHMERKEYRIYTCKNCPRVRISTRAGSAEDFLVDQESRPPCTNEVPCLVYQFEARDVAQERLHDAVRRSIGKQPYLRVFGCRRCTRVWIEKDGKPFKDCDNRTRCLHGCQKDLLARINVAEIGRAKSFCSYRDVESVSMCERYCVYTCLNCHQTVVRSHAVGEGHAEKDRWTCKDRCKSPSLDLLFAFTAAADLKDPALWHGLKRAAQVEMGAIVKKAKVIHEKAETLHALCVSLKESSKEKGKERED